MRARNGACSLPAGGGMRAMIVRNSSGTPTPVLPLTASTSARSSPSVCSISSLTSSGRDACMSILFSAGMIVRLELIAA